LDLAESAGDEEEADRILSEAIDAPPAPVHVETQTAKVAGVSSRKTWKAEVTDPVAFVKYVAEHPEHVNLLQVNMTQLNALARAMQENLKIPGVRVFQDRTHAVR
jgi:colicin import membrane protein